jgi:hypothetical protein
VSNPQKRKGDRAELEVQGICREELGVYARRALGAGRKDDVGDIHGVPSTVVQVVDSVELGKYLRRKPDEAERQRLELERLTGEAAFAVTFMRLRGGDYRCVQTPSQFFALWREAQA